MMSSAPVVRMDADRELVPLGSIANQVLILLADRLEAELRTGADGRLSVTRAVADELLHRVEAPPVRA